MMANDSEFMDGVEYGADVYVDMLSGEPWPYLQKKNKDASWRNR